MVDEDEIKAMENRLRTAGWVTPPHSGLTKDETRIKGQLQQLGVKAVSRKTVNGKDNGFGVLGPKVRAAGLWLAEHPDLAQFPLRPFMCKRFGLSYDDAGRAVAEAERLIGRIAP